jgi:hydroxymethylbilane synthase
LKIRIATRKSELALWQAEFVADQLRNISAVTTVELLPLSTRGDEILDKSLQKIGGKGLFIKELEVAMQAGSADIAVHSMKDVPADMPPGFCIAALLERANPTDALLSADGKSLQDLPHGALVGSSSLRRQAQLKAHRPDIDVRPLRGNVNTRIKKLQDGEYQAIILASAGLERLGMQSHITEQFSKERMLPAAAQGVIGIECLSDRRELRDLLETLEHRDTLYTTTAERAVAATLQANCQSPVASFAVLTDVGMTVEALVAMPDGSKILRSEASGPVSEAQSLGEAAAHQLLEQGAAALLGESDS